MTQSKPFTIKDLLLHSVLSRAGCHPDTIIRSFQELEHDLEALEVYRSKHAIRRHVYGDIIYLKDNSLFKMTSNKIPYWGPTLWDFYFTSPGSTSPNISLRRLLSNGGKLLDGKGETGRARDEVTSAKNEEAPHEVLPFPISDVIEAQEMKIRLGLCGISKQIGDDRSLCEDTFGSGCYPAPWPLLPFSYDAAPLAHHIPLYQLPRCLLVHDPWKLLRVNKSVETYQRQADDWPSHNYRTYSYTLALSDKGKERVKEELKAKEKENAHRRQKMLEDLGIDDPDVVPDGFDAMLLVPTSVRPGPAEPPILALYEAAPDPKSADSADLYLSPAEIIGEGNHSLVVKAEWELPRSLLVPDILCYECILQDVHKTLIALDGIDGSMKDEKWKLKSGLWKTHETGHSEEIRTGGFENLQLDPETPRSVNRLAPYILRPKNLETKYKYVGPLRPIKANVKWQNGDNYCSHISKRLHVDEGTRAHPPTAKVSVVAKLSRENDKHLKNEFENYEAFPPHLFEHWNGYNVVPPLHNPVPVGAVVPQYYGYYEPPKHQFRDPRLEYSSPIMLLEQCGSEVVINDLNMDDRIECASLFHRLHHAGYAHESVYPRNVLYQDGPLDRPEYQRGTGDFTEDGRKYTFRLIDFGRTWQSHRACQFEQKCVKDLTRY